ncbi:hypothetical protein [Marinifilum sp. D714]|uniref:hypothetical protein n=1 Tax=Marinifilum sp. D714 TaxID=2937523 RepID=UPI0027BCEBCF|nr:hypothetical protein [Marinifilum sp. D714]MDQ2180840.1 hypothetical protein [Marinifilum sp. D714]
MSIALLYIFEARNILKGLLELDNFSSDRICPDFRVNRIVIKVRINPEMVSPIAPISDDKLELFTPVGKVILS